MPRPSRPLSIAYSTSNFFLGTAERVYEEAGAEFEIPMHGFDGAGVGQGDGDARFGRNLRVPRHGITDAVQPWMVFVERLISKTLVFLYPSITSDRRKLSFSLQAKKNPASHDGFSIIDCFCTETKMLRNVFLLWR